MMRRTLVLACLLAAPSAASAGAQVYTGGNVLANPGGSLVGVVGYYAQQSLRMTPMLYAPGTLNLMSSLYRAEQLHILQTPPLTAAYQVVEASLRRVKASLPDAPTRLTELLRPDGTIDGSSLKMPALKPYQPESGPAGKLSTRKRIGGSGTRTADGKAPKGGTAAMLRNTAGSIDAGDVKASIGKFSALFDGSRGQGGLPASPVLP